VNQVLSQEEVDALLQSMVAGEIATETDRGPGEAAVPAFDFTSQERLIRGRMPALEVINEHFARAFRVSLSTNLRRTVDIQTGLVQMLKFAEFFQSLTLPASLHIFQMTPLRGQCLLAVDSQLVFALVECFLGGRGQTRFRMEGRDFTAIERRLINKVAVLAVQDLEKAWGPVHPLSMNISRVEINPLLVGIAAPHDLMVITQFQVEMEQAGGVLTLCLPHATLEPIKAKLHSGFQSEQLEPDRLWSSRISEQLREVAVNLVVELASTHLPARDILDLGVGDIITFNKKVSDPLMARVEGVPKLVGHAGLAGEIKAFKVQEFQPLH